VASLYLNKTPPSPAWLSGALQVTKSANLQPQDPSAPLLDVVAGGTSSTYQRLQAVAGNDTAATINTVRVQLWALAFATQAAPSLYLESMGGKKGVTIPAGGELPIDIGSGQEQPFTRPWDASHLLTSTAPEIVSHFVGGKVHCCIYGNVFAAGDPTSAQIPEQPNGPHPLLDVAGNRHHAQRNMTIQAQSTDGTMAFHMFAANPDPERDQVVVLQATELRPRELQDWELAELDALGPWIRRTRDAPGGGVPGIEVVLDGRTFPVGIARRPLEDLEMDVADGGAGTELKVGLGAGEARPMRVNATIPGEEFVLRTIDIAQTHEDGTVGGARVMVMAVPAELAEPRRKGE
jgi:hypothetical protein